MQLNIQTDKKLWSVRKSEYTHLIFRTAIFHIIFFLIIIHSTLLATSSRSQTSMFKNSENHPTDQESAGLKILYFMNHQTGQTVLVQGGQQQGLLNGSLLRAFRISPESGSRVATGLLKLIQVGENSSIAQVLQDSTSESKDLLLHYPEVMAGDLAEMIRYKIHPRVHALPKWSHTFRELFQKPGRHPSSFELSSQGRHLLSSGLSAFRGKHFGKILIKAHTDRPGDHAENQSESYQRALTIRQFMIDHLNFLADRVIAIGMGDSDLKNESHVYGSTEINRRIDISVTKEF